MTDAKPDPLTDTDLSRLVTLVVIHEGCSGSMSGQSAKNLFDHGLIEIDDSDAQWNALHTVTPDGRARVARMLAAGRGE
jgi:hypothetical protein